MVKRFFRLSFFSIFFQIISISLIFICTFMSIVSIHHIIVDATNGICDGVWIFDAIIFTCSVPMLVNAELQLSVGNVHLNYQDISICGDVRRGRNKIQFPAKIKYVDIADIEITALRTNSRGQSIFLTRPLAYLILTNKKGRKFRFGLHLMTNRSVRLMLLELAKKCEEVNGITFDIEKLMEDFKEARFAV